MYSSLLGREITRSGWPWRYYEGLDKIKGKKCTHEKPYTVRNCSLSNTAASQPLALALFQFQFLSWSATN